MISVEMESEGNDEVDGFLLRRCIGHYKPKEVEEKINNIASSDVHHYEDPDDKIYLLLRVTAPSIEWRIGFWSLLRADIKESSVRKILAFFQNVVESGMQKIESGMKDSNMFFDCHTSPVPDHLSHDAIVAVLKGLNLEMKLPESENETENIRAAIGQETNIEVLEGFYSLLRAISGLSWVNLQTLLKLKADVGHFLWEMLTLLRGGGGMDQSSRTQLSELQEGYPYLMKSLGFRRNGHSLQWEKPVSNEFDSLCLSLHGLFRPTDALESPL